MKTKEYLIKNFIPIAKEEAEGLTDVIECLESIEHYLSIPVEKRVMLKIAEVIKKHIDNYFNMQKEFYKKDEHYAVRVCDNKINALIELNKEIESNFSV